MRGLSFSVCALLAVSWSGLAPERSSGGEQGKTADPPKKAKGKFSISKETTYVTGPVDKDGYIDYVAALNERLRKGVTPANNANVLLFKAFGRAPEGGTGMPAEFFKWMERRRQWPR